MIKPAVYVSLYNRLDTKEITEWVENYTEYFCWDETYSKSTGFPVGVYLSKEDATAFVLKFDIRESIR
jgi:hypothetical protein